MKCRLYPDAMFADKPDHTMLKFDATFPGDQSIPCAPQPADLFCLLSISNSELQIGVSYLYIWAACRILEISQPGSLLIYVGDISGIFQNTITTISCMSPSKRRAGKTPASVVLTFGILEIFRSTKIQG